MPSSGRTFTLATPAAREVLRRLEAADGWARVERERRPLDARARELPGADVGVEQRLAPEQRWYDPAEFRRVLALHRLEPNQAAPAALGTRIHAGRRRRT